MITSLKTPMGIVTILIFILTILAAILSGVMGAAGPSTKVLFIAWLFVPAPIIPVVTLVHLVSTVRSLLIIMY